jgi:malate dehydrogenase (oxaloacetate-decarboxylating)
MTDDIRTMHERGKIAITSTRDVTTIADLRKIYTPGVAQVCEYIQQHPASVKDLTMIGNTVCIATNGTAVLGLGDIGVHPAMPVMEGKSVILNKFGGVNCMPILIDSKDADYIVETLCAIAPTFSAIMLEDISAPSCFEIEEKLQKRLNMPVFHDDQHGTACVVLSALISALKKVGKTKDSVRVVLNGAGAAGIAITKLLLEYGFKDLLICDREGILYEGCPKINHAQASIAKVTNRTQIKGTLINAMKGADIFVGVSAARCVTKEMVAGMAKKSIVFAMANPTPEIEPADASAAGAAVALDGKTVNNALCFPGLMRGALDVRANVITNAMKIKAAEAIAAQCKGDEIVPDFFDPALHNAVADAVASCVR